MAGDVQTTRGVRVKERDSLIGLPRSDDTWDPDNSRRLDPEQASSTGFGEAGVLGGVVSNNRSGFCPTTSGPNHMRTVLSINTEGASERRRGRHGEDGTGADADEEGEMEEDDDVDAATGEMDSASQPQTVEERLAARRKMKRFRYTAAATRAWEDASADKCVSQAHAPANEVLDERVFETSPSRRRPQGAAIAGNPGSESPTGSGLVPESVRAPAPGCAT